jgi:AraC-like DNA-binding protein
MESRNVVYVSHYKGQQQQPLRNVYIPAPTLVRVLRGSKLLLWRGERVEVTPERWLALPAGQSLTFVNEPGATGFESVTLSFLVQPPADWLANVTLTEKAPCLFSDASLTFCFDALVNGTEHQLAEATQQHLAMALLAQLHDTGALGLLFPGNKMTWRDRVSRYLMAEPGAEHSLEKAAQALGVSRATLHRRLKTEGYPFRQILADIRMGYSLTVMQKGCTVTEAALASGYESPARFSERFKQIFGVTPTQYRQTIKSF